MPYLMHRRVCSRCGSSSSMLYPMPKGRVGDDLPSGGIVELNDTCTECPACLHEVERIVLIKPGTPLPAFTVRPQVAAKPHTRPSSDAKPLALALRAALDSLDDL